MPCVSIRILEAHSQARKDEIADRVTAAVAQLPRDAVWVVFEDVAAGDWYAGGLAVSELKQQARS